MGLPEIKEQLSLGYATLKEKVPYFPIPLIVIIMLVAAAVFFLFSSVGNDTTVTISVMNTAGANVRDAQIIVSGLEAPLSLSTDRNGVASFNTTKGKQIKIVVKKQDYADENKSVEVLENLRLDFKLKPKSSEPPKEVNVVFVGPDGKKLSGKEVTVKLSCTGPAVFDKDELVVSEGELKFTPPLNCGSIKIGANAHGFKAAFATLTSKAGQVTLGGIDLPKASVDFDIKDAQTGKYVDGLIVSLYTKENIPTGLSTVTSYGSASFTKIDADNYNAVIDDPEGQYAAKTIDVSLTGGQNEKKQVLVSKDLKLRVMVFAKEGPNKVSGAKVLLFSGAKIAGEATTDANGSAVFAIDLAGDYALQASKENYLPSEKKTFSTGAFEKGSTQSFDLKMEKCTPKKCGLLKVRLTDEDNFAVENATLVLLGEDELVATAFGAVTTDFNGFAKFQNVTAGKFYVLAQKFPAEGKSELVVIDPAKENFAEMKVTIGLGNVTVTAKDVDGKPLSGMSVELLTDFGKSLGSVPVGENGTGATKVKADKRVYAVFKKDGYASYFTVARQVLPNKNLDFSATLDKSISGDSPRIIYSGFYSEAGSLADNLRSGSAYIGKFTVEMPSQNVFAEAGAFFRAGDLGKMENEVLQIEGINTSSLLVSKGTTYSPPNGTDEENQTEGNGKWASVNWKNPIAGKYEVEVKLRVKQGLTPGTELPFYYRAFAHEDSEYYRHPADAVLGTGKDNAQKKGFYAQAHQLRFLEGISELCKEEFCFSYRLLDKTENLFVESPFKVRAFSPYELEFVLTNNSGTDYSGAGLEIKNPGDRNDILITGYSIQNADNAAFNSGSPAGKINRFSAGEFTKNRSVRGTLAIEPKSLGPSVLEFKLFSNKEERFTGAVAFTPFTEGDIALDVRPANLVAFVPMTLDISATNATGEHAGFPLGGARVFVKRISPDRTSTIADALTGNDGVAKITLPASSSGTKVIIWAEKAGLGSNVVERQIASTVVLLSPEKITTQLNRQSKTEKRDQIDLTSIIARPIEIRSLRESISSKGLLDEEKMGNFLRQFVGREIAGNDMASIMVLSAVGKEADYLEKPKKVSGSLVLELGLKDDKNVSWISLIPYESTINLAEMPANAPCLSLSESSWEDSTVDNKSSLEFEITNNCISEEGNEIDVLNLQSSISWTGKDGQIGVVELSVTDPQTGEISREILQQSLSNKLLTRVKYGKPYPARLTFVPKGASVGKKAEFSVKVDAEIVTNAGKQFVGSENGIDSSIVIANIDRCVKFTPAADEGLRLKPGQNEAEFTIDTTECGPVDIDLRFCGEKGNYLCRGGTNEGGIEVSPDHFTRLHQESRTVKVTRQDIAGFYGLTIEARPAGGTFRRIAELDVTIEPEEGDYFTLDKYKFTTIGKGGKDSATVTNKMLQENVQVSANLCEWGAAAPGLSDGEKAGIGLGGAVAGAGIGYAAVLLGASTGIGAVVGLVVFMIIMFMTLFGEDPCEQFETHPLQDYVINLVGTSDQTAPKYIQPDAIDVGMTHQGLRGDWMLDISDAVQKTNNKYRNGKQTTGVVFENKGIEQDDPVYAVATLRAKEHVHGDPTHQNPAVQCGKKGTEQGDFGMFWINPGQCGEKGQVYDTTYAQKFHLKFNVAEDKTYIPKVEFDTYACDSGLEIGRTGPGALARVKFNWGWKESQNGISYNQCDAGNPDYVYCDATQFTIELNKKLYSLEEFLQANNYDLGCPLLPDERKDVDERENNANAGRASHGVAQGFVGTGKIILEPTSTGFRAIVTASNKTPSDQNIFIQVFGGSGPASTSNCQIEMRNVSANEDRNGACELAAGDETAYLYTAKVMQSTTDKIDNAAVSAIKIFGDPVKKESEEICKLRSTETVADVPQIMRFIDGKDNIRWTQNVPNKEALQKLLIFDAYLQKDTYSKEFFADFAKYYTKGSFEDTDSYFHSLSADAEGNKYGFDKLMTQGKFILRNKYIDSPELSAPGLYRIEFAVYFLGNDWRLFADNGDLQGYVAMVIHRIDDPKQQSPFYYMPLDGLVGIDGEKVNRQNYGTTFINDSGKPLLFINKDSSPMKTFQDNSSNPVSTVSVRKNEDIYSLNTAPGTRGMILEVNSKMDGKNESIVFQPSLATPLMLKVHTDKISQEKFSTYYSALENDARITTGTSLSYWDGAGNCLDFSGGPVTEAFYQKPDRQGKDTDRILDAQSTYALDWDRVLKNGDVYLRTIVYTNASRDTKIRVNQGSAGSFITPDESGNQVSLNGVAGMKFNNLSAGSTGRIESMQDVFDLVKSNNICVTSTGNSARFFWNPQAVYTAQGQESNISRIANSLQAGVSCIG